jgi:hypothetical protein
VIQERPIYYATIKPIREGQELMEGMNNIAYVPDPAVEEIGIYLNKQDARIVADDVIQNKILEYLKGCGITKPDHWKEVSEEEYLAAREVNLNEVTNQESYNDFPKKGGGGQWLVRYKYTGPIDDKTRDFCREVLSMGKLFTEEDIKNGLSNPEFGNYSIFDYKGSYGCRHVWKRQIYFEDYEDDEVRRVGFVPAVVNRLDDDMATTLNAFLSANEKMQVVAPLLIPEKRIPRADNIGIYDMVFSADSIRELRDVALSRKMFDKPDLFKDTHKGQAAPSYVVDQWITESPDDKAYTQYGFELSRNPIGTWFVHSQITDQNYWENEIKKNKKHAYSIEAIMNLSIVKLSKMTENQIKLPDGEHLINGTLYVVEGGVVVGTKEVPEAQEEVVEAVAEKAAEEAPEILAEKPATEAPEKMAEVPTDAPVEDDRIAKLEKQLEETLQAVAALKAEMQAPILEENKVEMSDNRPLWKRISDGLNSKK